MPARYVQLPNGSYLEWPEGISAADFKAKAQRVIGQSEPIQNVRGSAPDFKPVGLRQQFESEFVQPQMAPVNEGIGHHLLRAASNFGGGAIGGATAPFLHPVQTVQGIYHLAQAAQGNPTGLVQDIQPMVEQFRSHPEEATESLAGNIVGSTAAGEAIGKVAPMVARGGEAIRNAAIGDPNAAALRGFRIPAGSPKALRTIKAVEGARPYLQGVQSLEDLQARIPKAKTEIWGPYQHTVEEIGGKKVTGPDGPTTVDALEQERLQTSALLRELKAKNPEAIQLAQQKGLTQADLLSREKAIQSALDPHLEEAGISPKAIRRTFGNVAQIGERVSGKSTLAEKPQQYGLGRIANLSIEHPLAAPKEIIGGIRDIAAGRPWFQGSPTDIGIREAFRTAEEKPWLGRFSRPMTEPPQLEANVPGNAPYGESFAEGHVPAAPIRVGQPPPSRLALPSATGAGEAQPMIGVLKHPGAMRSFHPETTRIAPPQFAGPEPTPPRNLVVTPSGEVHNLPRYQLPGGFTTPPIPEPTEAHIYPAGSQFRNIQETPYYPAGSAFRGKVAPFDVEEYLKGNQ